MLATITRHFQPIGISNTLPSPTLTLLQTYSRTGGWDVMNIYRTPPHSFLLPFDLPVSPPARHAISPKCLLPLTATFTHPTPPMHRNLRPVYHPVDRYPTLSFDHPLKILHNDATHRCFSCTPTPAS
eukprot:758743-Hanusia_phi.AAC.3